MLTPTRRQFLARSSLAAGAFALASTLPRWGLAEELVRTPRQTEGPFYPDHLPLDTDNDLIIVNDHLTAAVGQITHLSGRILDSNGNPIRNALVEIWQADANGVYLHSQSMNGDRRDSNFQGFGRFLTGSGGEYYFRTIKPVPYPGRTSHIHFAVKCPEHDRFTTQCYIKGFEQNARDMVLRGIRDERQRASVEVDFAPIPQSKINELSAKFDVVMGQTPAA